MRTLLTTLILFVSATVFAQVELTASGLHFSDTETNYLVYDFPGMDQEAIYGKALQYFSSNATSPKDAISEIKNEMLTVNAVAGGVVHRTANHVFNLDYTFAVRVKDGKLRVDLPAVNSIVSTQFGKVQVINVCSGTSLSGDYFGIYSEKGKLKLDRSKATLEQFFNDEINNLLAEIETSNDW